MSVGAQGELTIDLAGQWHFALLEEGRLPDYSGLVTLPGTTDTNQKGNALNRFDETTHLSRHYSYKGRAWYSREFDIPEEWDGRPVRLFLERTKYTEVFVDGLPCGSCSDISTPQVYDLTKWLTPGHHLMVIIVDNGSGVPNQLYASSHAYTEDTQTNWNGIIGKILLSADSTILSPHAAISPPSLTYDSSHFYQDGKKLFLRGKHDACVWPLTGYMPMDVPSWLNYLRTCADYGINHVRFHSWCPPEAAFVAADSLNIILQPELPFWGDFNDKDTTLMNFLHMEGENILRWYGHHRSFRMFALGNELWGSIDKMREFVDDFRRIAPDKLYTFGSNYYLGYQGVKPDMDYFTTCRVGGEAWGSYNTHTRGSFSFADAFEGGMINHFRPNAKMNFEEGCARSSVPVISHETAQFQTYPDYSEIKKYTGVLRPCNMEVFRQRLTDAGMADQAEAFHRASGRWSYLLYKQDIEMDLRTPNMAGFQLLDLQDYPGQGSAYVGILDAFMESKGICTREEWRQFCSPVVPLLVSDSYCFTFCEGIHGKIQVANYSGGSLSGQKIGWECAGQQGELAIPDGEGLLDIGAIDIDLSHLKKATRLKLILRMVNAQNTYDLYAYPDEVKLNKKGIIIAKDLTDDITLELQKGAKVLMMPDSTELCVGGLFQTDYWNYRMFKTICENNKKPVSPGTLGLLCYPKHPLLKDFPTEEHTSWQWWPVVKWSHPFILDNTNKSYRPLVQVIDNIERNHKLGLVFEFQVGKGRLLVVMSDLDKASQYPEGRQFYASVLNYMHSKGFAPATHITADQLRLLFSSMVNEAQLQELNNISPY
ncbi:MAG: beta-glycosidase [Prevotella sp.]|nr:beta-glycosidase [Prevotella sp.]